MGSHPAPVALGGSANGILLIGVLAVIVLLCTGFAISASLRVRRIDRAEPAASPADSGAPADATSSVPAGIPADFADDPDYQGPGDWDGGPLDPPEFRTTSD